MQQHNPKETKDQKGFTLIEMVVVTAIVGIISSIILFQYSNFSNRIILTNMAYEIALTVRQAQVYGLGAKSFDGNFDQPYGAWFDISSEPAGSFIFFRDGIEGQPVAQENLRCDGPVGFCTCSGALDDECVQSFSFTRGIKITEIFTQSVDGICAPAVQVGVSFKRPDPNARIYDSIHGNDRLLVQVTVESQQGDQDFLIVRRTGQVEVVDNPVCTLLEDDS